MDYLPEQEELRRRFKAARALRDLTVRQLADLMPPESRLGERTLRKLDSGESILTPPILRELAHRLGVPYTWFSAPDLAAEISGASLEERVEALEKAQRDLWATIQSGPPVPPRGAARHVPPRDESSASTQTA